ncbi:N-acetylmuramoyl-L-alanine amidase [Flavobacterium sp. NKUCC04_CG]|uniref:N-acetylmuramoyl-L-alanine amidase family protein n=1 Tax=Flavobacterium sp. NKUCC04_CG TaxID=2842121 RepID=UPI001C5AE7B8|nr:N-acetylmuramoyl-L-alanine amidase [Flavobacterium sp. NKUCC04_CG]MBW3517965.1 N-acetylmuramoyl-L-alanine amidase [Flavobacterium sp. NKUCC04_CG]
MNLSKSKFLLIGIFLFTSIFTYAQSNSKFKVVLDAGHGGKDFGTSHNGNVEKRIVLSVVLKVGEILERQPDIDVIYTRKTDVFVEVKERSVIANKENGNVFISVHCNGVNSSDASGTETYVMGLSKNKSNLEVAKKENAAITLEDDYKNKYAGFDPNSPESLIGLTLMQEDYVGQSIDLASKVQDGFTNDLKRKSRGVKQGPFWVLHGAFMPSILIELGFVSHKDEGEYLNSERGQMELAESIAKGIINYKKDFYSASKGAVVSTVKDSKQDKKDTIKEIEPKVAAKNEAAKPEKQEKQEKEVVTAKDVVFRIQISASSKVLELKPSNFNGLSSITMLKEGNLNKYYYSETTDYKTAQKALGEAKNKGYTSSFIVAFKKGKKVSVQEALK